MHGNEITRFQRIRPCLIVVYGMVMRLIGGIPGTAAPVACLADDMPRVSRHPVVREIDALGRYHDVVPSHGELRRRRDDHPDARLRPCMLFCDIVLHRKHLGYAVLCGWYHLFCHSVSPQLSLSFFFSTSSLFMMFSNSRTSFISCSPSWKVCVSAFTQNCAETLFCRLSLTLIE